MIGGAAEAAESGAVDQEEEMNKKKIQVASATKQAGNGIFVAVDVPGLPMKTNVAVTDRDRAVGSPRRTRWVRCLLLGLRSLISPSVSADTFTARLRRLNRARYLTRTAVIDGLRRTYLYGAGPRGLTLERRVRRPSTAQLDHTLADRTGAGRVAATRVCCAGGDCRLGRRVGNSRLGATRLAVPRPAAAVAHRRRPGLCTSRSTGRPNPAPRYAANSLATSRSVDRAPYSSSRRHRHARRTWRTWRRNGFAALITTAPAIERAEPGGDRHSETADLATERSHRSTHEVRDTVEDHVSAAIVRGRAGASSPLAPLRGRLRRGLTHRQASGTAADRETSQRQSVHNAGCGR